MSLVSLRAAPLLGMMLACALSISPVSAQQPPAPASGASQQGISDEAVRAEYERFKASVGDKEYHVAHILLTEKEATQQLIDRLAKGEKFSELAAMYSRDPGSARRGGDLGWNSMASFVPEFSKAMAELAPGEYSHAPVRTQFGWHIIEVIEVKPTEVPPFEQVKERIRTFLAGRKLK